MIRMRDKNLNLKQFNIQLERNVKKSFLTNDRFLTRPVFVTPTRCIDPTEVKIVYPRDFRLLRILFISHWYYPEVLFWRIHLDLEEFSLSQLNKKQKLELRILLSSKENMEKYLYRTKRYSSSELFGNILGNDLRDLEKFLEFHKIKHSKPRRLVRRRGYKDKGSRRPSHQWKEKYDISFIEYQNELEKENLKLHKLLKRILLILENYD